MSIWDVTLNDSQATQQTNEYPIAPAGVYDFTVTNVTAKEYKPKPNSKIPNCAELDVRLTIKGGSADGKDVNVFDRLYFADSTMWKAIAFAKCIGVYHSGMSFKELQNGCVGEAGKFKVSIREYNGKKSNQVETYYYTESAPTVKSDLGSNNDDLPF